MFKSGYEQSIKLLWIAGMVVWFPTVLLLMYRHSESQSYAQASLRSMQVIFVALFGTFWSIAGASWLARLRKTSGGPSTPAAGS